MKTLRQLFEEACGQRWLSGVGPQWPLKAQEMAAWLEHLIFTRGDWVLMKPEAKEPEPSGGDCGSWTAADDFRAAKVGRVR